MSPVFVAWLLASTMTNERQDAGDREGLSRSLCAEDALLKRATENELIAVQIEALEAP